MKLSLKTKAPIVLLLGFISPIFGQQLIPTHATFSAFTTGNHSGHILKVNSIVQTGPCVTVEFIEYVIPGGHLQVLVEYEEHISIPILSDEIQVIDSRNQYGDSVDAVFHWQDEIFIPINCPLRVSEPLEISTLYNLESSRPIINTSNRSEVSEGHPAIAGFVLNQPSWVIIRGIGPSMNLNSDYLDDPVITLHADQYLFDDFNDDLENSITNDNWQDTLRVETLEYFDLVPQDERESALITYLLPGPYTVHLTTNGEAGSGLVEVFVAPYALPSE